MYGSVYNNFVRKLHSSPVSILHHKFSTSYLVTLPEMQCGTDVTFNNWSLK